MSRVRGKCLSEVRDITDVNKEMIDNSEDVFN